MPTSRELVEDADLLLERVDRTRVSVSIVIPPGWEIQGVRLFEMRRNWFRAPTLRTRTANVYFVHGLLLEIILSYSVEHSRLLSVYTDFIATSLVHPLFLNVQGSWRKFNRNDWIPQTDHLYLLQILWRDSTGFSALIGGEQSRLSELD